jgi:3-mercaptopyruvate sulfurtransferase SseA
MQAARIEWTLNMFDNYNVRVISGGVKALTGAGAKLTGEPAKLRRPRI